MSHSGSRPATGRVALLRVLTGSLLLVAAVAGVPGVAGRGAPAARADTRPATGTPATTSADALPTVQVDGVVWKTAVVGTTVYAVGKFQHARPAGTAPGDPAEQVRQNALAFDLTTGALLPWAPALNAQALVVRAAPDGSRIYVGGDFTAVDGQVRQHLAAFDTVTGALDPVLAPNVGATVWAVAVTASTVYVGGTFLAVGVAPRQRLAAFSRSTGNLLPWAPTADDDQVEALAAAPDDSRIVVGGRFQTLNGQPHVGLGAVDGTTGASVRWDSAPEPAAVTDSKGVVSRAWVTDLVLQGSVVYGGSNGDGIHWFDGRFAADLATGALVWLDNCYGATYGVYPAGDVLYSASHAHDCSSLGAWPQTVHPDGTSLTFHRLLAETTVATGTDPAPRGTNSNYEHQSVPSLLHWFPDVNIGTYTGQNQGAWTMSGGGGYVVAGGEFTRVNGVPQQGLVRFTQAGSAPNLVGPAYRPALLPTAVSAAPGAIRVSWPTTYDQDNATLTYRLYRDDRTLVYSADQAPTGWAPGGVSWPTGPPMGFSDTGLVPGSTHRYRLRVSDPYDNNLDYMRSPVVTVAGSPPTGYAASVLSDAPSAYWRLGEPEDGAVDLAGDNAMYKNAGVAPATAGAVPDDLASTFDGTATGFAVTKSPLAAPATFTVEAWVSTTSATGGRIVGFGVSPVDLSTYGSDRQLYLDDTGRVLFGVGVSGRATLASQPGLNDGAWHHVVGTLDPVEGMTLYVDSLRVARNPAVTRDPSYAGYWRVGGDTLRGWPSAPASGFLAGSVDEVAVYPTALSREVVARHFVDSGRTVPAGNAAPRPGLSVSCVWLLCAADAGRSVDPDGAIVNYRFGYPDGTSANGPSPRVEHVYGVAGTTPVTLTVTDDQGATATVSVDATPAGTPGPRPGHRSGMLQRFR